METLEKSIKAMFHALDTGAYETLMTMLADQVHLDMSSLTEVPGQDLSKSGIIAEVEEILPGFEVRQRQLTVDKIVASGDHALAKCTSAIQYNLTAEDIAFWGVAGTYYIDFMKGADQYLIDGITFHLKEMTGDETLLIQAWERVNEVNELLKHATQIAS